MRKRIIIEKYQNLKNTQVFTFIVMDFATKLG